MLRTLAACPCGQAPHRSDGDVGTLPPPVAALISIEREQPMSHTSPRPFTRACFRLPVRPRLLSLALGATLPASAATYSGPIVIDAGDERSFSSDLIAQDRPGTALTVRDPGSQAGLADVVVRVESAVAGAGHGIQAIGGGSVTLAGSSIDLGTDGSGVALDATGAGSTIRADGLQVRAGTQGGGGLLSASDGATMQLHGLLVDNRGDLLQVDGAGTSMLLEDARLQGGGSGRMRAGNGASLAIRNSVIDIAGATTGTFGGLWASNGANVALENVEYTNGFIDLASGASATLDAVTMSGTRGSMRLFGDAARQRYSTATVNGGRFDSSSDIGFNVNAWGRLDARGTLIRSTSGNGSPAIWLSSDSSRLQLADSTVDVDGDNRHAIEMYGGQAAISGGELIVRGAGGQAVRATGSTGSTSTWLQADGTRIDLLGAGSTGIFLGGSSTRASLQDLHIGSDAERAFGVVQVNTATLDAASGLDVDLRGDQSVGWRSYITAAGAHWNRASIEDSRFAAGAGTAFWLQGGNHELLLRGSLADVGDASGRLLRVGDTLLGDGSRIAAGDVRFSAAASDLRGDIQVDSPTAELHVALRDGTHWRGALLESDGLHARSLSVDGSSQWMVNGDSAVTALEHAGRISFAPPVADRFSRLTVHGDYVGQDGLFDINTRLAGDTAPTDFLHIEGSSSGSAWLHVDNAGGGGADTVEGIRVVQVDGDSNAVFQLQGRAVAGAYEYFLHQGSSSDAEDGDWYLRSLVPEGEKGPCEQDPAAPGCQTIDPDPPPVVEPPVIDPVVEPFVLRPEAGAWLANQSAALDMFALTLHQRVGEPNLAERQRDSGRLAGAWVRASNGQSQQRVNGQLAARGSHELLQVGADLTRWGTEDRGVFGIMGGAGHAAQQASSSLSGYHADGRVRGRSFGFYGTWTQGAMDDAGLYVDGWLQAARFRSSVNGQALVAEEYRARSTTASLETGYAFAVLHAAASTLYLEPQLQLSWSDYRMQGGTHVEANGTRVRVADAGGLQSRVGLRLHGRADTALAAVVQPFITADWIVRHGANAMVLDDVRVAGGRPGNVYQARAGAQLQLGRRLTAWGELDVGNGDGGYRDAAALLGVKYSW